MTLGYFKATLRNIVGFATCYDSKHLKIHMNKLSEKKDKRIILIIFHGHFLIVKKANCIYHKNRSNQVKIAAL